MAADSAAAANTGPAHLVKDINTGRDRGDGSDPAEFVAVGATIFFSAEDDRHGRELWRSDGTPDGTTLVRDLVPGAGSSSPTELTPAGDVLYFVAADAPGAALWKTDGTAAGTVPLGVGYGAPRDLTLAGSTLYFFVGSSLWKSDGTASGTQLVVELNTSFSSPAVPCGLVAVGDRVFFRSFDYDAGIELWGSDGTDYGTQMVADIRPGIDSGVADSCDAPLGVTAVMSDTLFFLADDGTTGWELWRSDGTAENTRLVRDVWPGPDSPFVAGNAFQSLFTVVDDVLYFAASDGSSGHELWRSDGTADGTRLVADLVAGAGGIFDCDTYGCWDSDIAANVVIDGVLYFTNQVYENGQFVRRELWASDGSTAGTVRLEDDLGPRSFFGTVLANVGSTLYFLRRFDETSELWRRDVGATQSVRLGVADNIFRLIGTAIGVVFNGYTTASGAEPWRSDGTPAGTGMLKDVRTDAAGSFPRELTAFGDRLVFSAQDETRGRELWVSDATEAGTVQLVDINPAGSADPHQLVRLGEALLFVADDGVHGAELWRSDGTAAGTAMVADVYPGAAASSPDRLVVAGDALYFFADDGVHGRELWRSDGSAAGTRLVRDLWPGPGGGGDFRLDPINLPTTAILNGLLFFTAQDGESGVELWRTDGTEAGTVRVVDATPGPEWSSPAALVVVDGRLLFRVGGLGESLWSSDGTEEGSGLVASFDDADGGATVVAGNAFFTARRSGFYYDDPDEFGLWRSDGTEAGTTLLLSQPGAAVFNLIDAGGTLYGLLNSGGYDLYHDIDDPHWRYEHLGGDELWRPDLGTLLLSAQNIVDIGAVDTSVLFIVDPYYPEPRQLWASDGSIDGTLLLQTLPQNTRRFVDEQFADFTRVGDRVFFVGSDFGGVGCELWSLPAAAVPGVSVPTATATATQTSTATPSATPTQTSRPHGGGSGGGCQVSSGGSHGDVAVLLGAFALAGLRRRRRG